MIRFGLLVGLPSLLRLAARGRDHATPPEPVTLRPWIPGVALGLVAGTLGILHHLAGWTTWLDLGLYAQFLHQIQAGDLSSLAFPHFSPILLALSPLAWLPPALLPFALLALQAAAVGAVPMVFVGAARQHAPRSVPLVATILCLLFPLWYLAVVNFRLEAIWLLFASLAVRALLDERRGAFLGWSVAALLVKTHLIVPMVVLGAVVAVTRRWKRETAIVISVGATLLVVEYLLLYPAAQVHVEQRVLETPLLRATRAGLWGFADPKYWTLLGTLLLATVILPLRRRELLLGALPVVSYLALPIAPEYRNLENHYLISAVPFLLGATIMGLAHRETQGRIPRLLPLLPSLLVLHVLCAPSPLSVRFFRAESVPYCAACYRPSTSPFAREALVRRTVPAGASVSLENDVVVGALLESRRIRVFPEGTEGEAACEWLVLSTTGGDWILDQHLPERYRAEVAALPERGYRLTAEGEGLRIYQRVR